MTAESPEPSPTRAASVPWLVRAAPVLLLALALGMLVLRRDRSQEQRLPIYATLPPFQLVDQDSRPFTEANFQGKVSIVDFIFTRCTTVCPVLTERMRRAQQEAQARGVAVQFVSISVDPRYDTPARLTTYARTRGLNTGNWRLLTGSIEALEPVVLDGFRVLMGREPSDGGDDDFASVFHGDHFVLVDGQGRIRGYYKVMDDADGLRMLLRDAEPLAHSGG